MLIMETVLSAVSGNPTQSQIHGGDSTSDRLSSVYTVKILMGFAVFTQVSHMFGSPVQCWCPAHFTATHAQYTNTACWTSNTYYLPHTARLPGEDADKEYISYYQWVALVLTFQAVAFLLPRPLWRSLSSLSGVAVSTLTDAAIECDKARKQEDRDKAVHFMVQHMDMFLSKLGPGWFAGALRGYFLPLAYVLVKVLYLGNVVGQLFIINKFLGTDYHLYGIQIMDRMVRGESWINSSRFPRVTLCDIYVRVLGNVHRYTVQCSLPMNIFNEIIYILIWFWFVLVAAVTAGSCAVSTMNLAVPYFNRSFVRQRLVAMRRISGDGAKDDPAVRRFIDDYLKGDGCFMLRMVKKNASDLIASEIMAGLWDKLQYTATQGSYPELTRLISVPHSG